MIFSLILATALSGTQFFLASDPWNSSDRFVPPVHEVLIPIGFDDNDVVEVIVDIEFRDSCEDFYGARVIRQAELKDVLLLQIEAKRREGMCLEVINRQPFIVKIGELARHESGYRVVDFKTMNRDYGKLRIRKANSSKIDENNYAPVTSLRAKEEPNSLRRSIELAGFFMDTCTFFKEVHVARTGEYLIEVLPIIDRMESPDCEKRPVAFNQIVDIPQRSGQHRVASGRYVFYVRTANGGSFVTQDYLAYE
jgi:hypothetical protein